MLGLLAVIILALFSEIERELRDQLAKSSAYTVYVSEFVPADHAATILRRTYEEELMWSGRNGPDVIRQVRQSLVSASWNRTQTLPLLAFTDSATDLNDARDPTAPPVLWLLTDAAGQKNQQEEISIIGKRARAQVRPVPQWIRRELSMSCAVAAPVEMIEPFLLKGFINHTIACFASIPEVERFVNDVAAYYRAEQRQVKIVSGLEILRNLERITRIQRIVRTWIVVGCGVILALTLGSIAWLEYRQDAYLLALLKSFGTPSLLLLLHMFLENLLLVFTGIVLARLAWPPLCRLAVPQLHAIGLHGGDAATLPAGDLAIIVLAGVVGVVLAMVPVAFGLRRPAGLILQ